MRKLVWVLVALPWLWSTAASAQNVTINGATIIWYGNYKPGKIETVPDPNTPSGTKDVVSDLTPPRTNGDRIVAVAPSYFGFGYRLNGRPASTVVTIRHVRKLPPPGLRNEKTGQMMRVVETSIRASSDRDDLFIGQAITDPSTLPIGTWTFQVFYGDQLLAEKSFDIVEGGASR
jgi:hypothetical protein